MYIKYYISLILLIELSSCDLQDGKLTLINNTNDTIFYSLSYGIDSITDYPVSQYNGIDNYNASAIILALDSHMCASMDPWEVVINKSKDSTLSIFFFEKDLIQFVRKDSLMKYQSYSKMKKLKVIDLQKLNWRVTYP